MSGQIIGYARVSSTGQSLDIQMAALKAAGCSKIYHEKISGTTAARPRFQALKSYLREGDTLVVSKLDRLARSVLDLNKFIDDMEKRSVRVQILNQSIDTATPTGKMMIQMLAAVAEFENCLRRERQLEGIKAARENGTKFGRKAKLTKSQILTLKQMKTDRVPVNDIARKFGISRASVYRLARV